MRKGWVFTHAPLSNEGDKPVLTVCILQTHRRIIEVRCPIGEEIETMILMTNHCIKQGDT